MSQTTYLSMTLVDVGQNQKEVTINGDFTILDTLLQALVAANNGKLLGMTSGHTTPIGTALPVQISGGNVGLNLPSNSAVFLNGLGGWTTPAGTGGGTVNSVAMSVPDIFNLTGSPITNSGTFAVSLVSQSANLVWAGPPSGAASTPTFRAMVAADLPAVTTTAQGAAPTLPNDSAKFLNGVGAWAVPPGGATGTVTSVALTMPGIFSVAGSPITSSGTLAVTFATQSANLFFAGPSSGAAATPTFRSIVAADMPAATTSAQGALPQLDGSTAHYLNGNGAWAAPAFVSSVALSMPGIFSVSGSPITSTGTFAVTLATQSANLVWAGPSSGSAATPTFRALVTADMPKVKGNIVTLTDASTVAVDASLGNRFRLLCTAAVGATRKIGNPTNAVDGQMIIFEIQQSSGGSNAVTWDTNFAWGTTVTVPTMSTGVNKLDTVGCVYRSSLTKWLGIAVALGYN